MLPDIIPRILRDSEFVFLLICSESLSLHFFVRYVDQFMKILWMSQDATRHPRPWASLGAWEPQGRAGKSWSIT